MSKPQFFRQCVLVSSTHETVGWIKDESARVGSRLQILDDPAMDSETTWTVQSVGSVRITDHEAKEKERLFTRHRKATDI